MSRLNRPVARYGFICGRQSRGSAPQAAAVSSARILPGCLQQSFQFFDRFGVLRADWLVAAAGIRSLQSTNHRTRNRERRATVAGFANEVPLRSSWNVTAKTVPAKSIDDIDGPSFANLCSIFRHVQRKELPIMRCSVEAPVPLDHGLGWNQLNDGSRWIHGARGRIRGGQRRVEMALQVVHVELTDRGHLRDTPE